MPRNRKPRIIYTPPLMLGYKPFGISNEAGLVLELFYEEYESLRLIHYNHLSQEDAAELMCISRPTFTRIYNVALEKISNAFVEGKSLKICGGNYQFTKPWMRCKNCFKIFDDEQKHTHCPKCKKYSNDELENL